MKQDFPAIADSSICYLDSGALTQVPKIVSDAVSVYLTSETANADRGSYSWANQITKEVLETRKMVDNFIGSEDQTHVFFTSGASESAHLIACKWGLTNLKDGDEILYCDQDHKSTIEPWIEVQNILNSYGANINLVAYKTNAIGEVDKHDLLKKVSSKTRLIIGTHIHHVFGTKTTFKDIKDQIDPSIRIIVDCSQSIGKVVVRVDDLGADFVYFSGHKMFAPTGIGILYSRRDERLFKEVGTLNLSGIIGLKAAISFMERIGVEAISQQQFELTHYLVEQLRTINAIEFLPGVALAKCAVGYGIVSFKITGLSSDDIGFGLSEFGVYVRTGKMCMDPNSEFADSVRVSMQIYTSKEDVDRLIRSLREIVLPSTSHKDTYLNWDSD